jgi:hypothetical protein
MLLKASIFFFAAIADAGHAAVQSVAANATTSRASTTSSSPSTTSVFPMITPAAYYNPAAFTNPYWFVLINTSGDLAQSSIVSCGNIWQSSFTEWLATAPVTTGPSIPAITATETLLPSFAYQNISGEIVTSTFPPQTYTVTTAAQGPLYYANAEGGLDFTASEPCCQTCQIFGGTVQVLYWPTTTASPAASTLVNSEGFTL